MAKKKRNEITTKKVKDIEDRLSEKFGDIFVTGNYITQTKRTVVPVSPLMDGILGGGIPFGSFVIPTGPPKVGKTSMALDMAGTALGIPSEFEDARKLYFFNIEGRINKRDLEGIKHLKPYLSDDDWENSERIKVIGSKPGKILTAEEYLEIGEALINEKPGSIFIFDSFSQLCSKSGRDYEWDGKGYRDDVPKFLSMFCKRISNVIPINKCIVVGITHRIANTGFGFSPWAEASGNKIQYAVDVKLHATHCKPWEENGSKIGQEVFWECACSPLLNGPVQNSCSSKLRYGYGIDKPAELVNIAVDLGIIKKSGSWYKMGENDEICVQGLEKMRNIIAEDETLYNSINNQYREMMGLNDAGL